MTSIIRKEREVWRCEIHHGSGADAGIELLILAVDISGRAVSARWRIIERRNGSQLFHEGEPVVGFDGRIPSGALRKQALKYCATTTTLYGDDWPILEFAEACS